MPLGQFADVFSLKINQFKWSIWGMSVSPGMSDCYKLEMTSHLKALEARLDHFC